MPFETFLGRLKVKVTLEGLNELLWAIVPTYMHGFQIISHRCVLLEE